MHTEQTHPCNAAGHAPGAAQPGVLLVGPNGETLHALADLVRATLPSLRIETLASTTELVFRLASGDGVIVLIDGACPDDLPPSLLKLSRRASGRPRLALVGQARGPLPATGRPLSLQELPAWLLLAAAPAHSPRGAPSERSARLVRPKVLSP